MKPLYMWAGGKNKMIPKYQETPGIPYSGYDTYVEPFFGGGAMMIHIYENNPNVKNFVLNDINPEIVGLYYAIRDNVEQFIAECDSYCNHYLSLDKANRKIYYYQVRKAYTTQYHSWSATKESATLYFLMKTAFNGIWQSTKEAKGRFCTPSGLLNHKDSVYDKENVMEWHKFLQKVSIHSGQWKDCCNNIQGRALYFFDPPYRNSFTQYGTDFDDTRHLELIDFCKTADLAGHLVMYCNREAGDDFYTKNQGQLDIGYYDITYTAGRRKINDDGSQTAKQAKEILLYSNDIRNLNCVIPDKSSTTKTSKSKKQKISKLANPSLIEFV